MKNEITSIFTANRFKILLFLVLYLLGAQIIAVYNQGEVALKGLEYNLLLISIVLVLIYNIPYNIVPVGIVLILLIGLFGVPVGSVIYVLAVYMLLSLVRETRRGKKQ